MPTSNVVEAMPTLCSLCDEISGEMPATFRNASGLTHRIIRETPSFVVLPSISPLASGHVMIVPACHSSGMLNVAEKRDEFLSLVDLVIARVSASYGPSTLFEHGIGLGKTGGCGIDHAHVHVLPLSLADTSAVQGALEDELGHARHIPLSQAFQEHDRARSYLFFGASPSHVAIHYSEEIRSQYIRHLIATTMNQPRRHWREMFGWDQFAETFERLSQSLR